MKITTLQITLDVVHGGEIDPVDVARHAAHLAHDQVTRPVGDDEVGMVSSTILGTRDYEGKGARSYDACDCDDCKALDAAAEDVDDADERRARAMKITELQITLDVVHRDEIDPTDVAVDVADTAHDAVTWTMWPGLAEAIDRAHRVGGDGVGVVSTMALGTRDYEGSARAYDDKDDVDDNDDETVVSNEAADGFS